MKGVLNPIINVPVWCVTQNSAHRIGAVLVNDNIKNGLNVWRKQVGGLFHFRFEFNALTANMKCPCLHDEWFADFSRRDFPGLHNSRHKQTILVHSVRIKNTTFKIGKTLVYQRCVNIFYRFGGEAKFFKLVDGFSVAVTATNNLSGYIGGGDVN